MLVCVFVCLLGFCLFVCCLFACLFVFGFVCGCRCVSSGLTSSFLLALQVNKKYNADGTVTETTVYIFEEVLCLSFHDVTFSHPMFAFFCEIISTIHATHAHANTHVRHIIYVRHARMHSSIHPSTHACVHTPTYMHTCLHIHAHIVW